MDVELVAIPAADDVQADAAVADVIDGGDRLGGEGRRGDRHMGGDEDADPLGEAAAAAPG